MMGRKKNIKQYSPLTNLILYGLLLIVTPFLLLQNYLQSAIGMLSEFSLEISGFAIPYIVLMAIIVVSTLIFKNRKQLTKFRIISFLIVISLMIIGQKSTDFYFHHNFYDLQHNWHYFAYGIFSFIAYRFFKKKGKPPEKIILFTFLSAILISTFDEFIQIHISNRIFDICDIGKDVWGTVIGLILIFFVIEEGKIIKKGWKIRRKKIRDYFRNPFSILFLELVFAYLLISISSVLTEINYSHIAVLFSLGTFILFFSILHLSRIKIFRIVFIILLISIITIQGYFYFKYKNKNIVYNSFGLTVYKGIPLPFFDIMIFENGFFRFVDKKHVFNKRDINTIGSYTSDILLIGAGKYGKGGKGFPEDLITQFIFNKEKKNVIQIIILSTPEACVKFNQLKKEGYNVVFIIHNTC
ncbi:MAG TPA: hypothetical protein ENL20_04325 [Candidatus Cloacimonetes bacterium]|nr:hypothetical protein [Candidatus Cloacimonadota bacterium]